MAQQSIKNIQLEYVDGLPRIARDIKPIDKYNPDGISLDAIDWEIDFALTLGRIDLALFRRIRLENKLIGRRFWSRKKKRAIAFGISLINISPDDLIDPYDMDLADEINKCPAALLFSDIHRDALARWFYVRLISNSVAERKPADDLINALSSVKGRGRTKMYPVDMAQLKQADRDLRTYRKLIFNCMRDTKSIEKVKSSFPRYEQVEKALITASKKRENKLSLITPFARAAREGGVALAAEGSFSHAYIAHRIGYEMRTVEELFGNRKKRPKLK